MPLISVSVLLPVSTLSHMLQISLQSPYNSPRAACASSARSSNGQGSEPTVCSSSSSSSSSSYKWDSSGEKSFTLNDLSVCHEPTLVISAVAFKLNLSVFSPLRASFERTQQSWMRTKSTGLLPSELRCASIAARKWFDPEPTSLQEGKQLWYDFGLWAATVNCSNGSKGQCGKKKKMWFRTEKQKTLLATVHKMFLN